MENWIIIKFEEMQYNNYTMEDILTLSVSEKEEEFVKYGLETALDISSEIIDSLYDVPYIGQFLKIGKIGNKFYELHFIRKVALFLKSGRNIPLKEKQAFVTSITPKQRSIIHQYLTHYLLRAEDDYKAEIMGYLYKERIIGNIDNELFLRLCSIIDKIFISDLKELPKYVTKSTTYSTAINSYINLGLADNFVGGYWVGEPTYELNDIGLTLYKILNQNRWF